VPNQFDICSVTVQSLTSEHSLIIFAVFPRSGKFVNFVEAAVTNVLTSVLIESYCESTRH
jgi:hypothetical protein